MQDIKDCKGRLTCRGDALTGLVESLYKGQLTSTILSPGEVFTIERQGVITEVLRTGYNTFSVRSYEKAS
jgi:hypothetical protein